MRPLMRFPTAVPRDPAVQAWLDNHADTLGAIAGQWFTALRRSGSDVRELLHDGMPTACVGDAAFAYVNAFKAHVNVGFFCGAELPDPARLLQGTGRFMRHVKLRPDVATDAAALATLIAAAHADAKARLLAEDTAPRKA